MKEKLTKEIYVIVFIIGSLIIYNVVPLIASNIKFESYNILEFLSLVLINPVYIVICGFIYGKKYGLSWFVPIILGCTFIPTAAIFFDVSYLFYILIYFIFCVPSEILGISFNRISQLREK